MNTNYECNECGHEFENDYYGTCPSCGEDNIEQNIQIERN